MTGYILPFTSTWYLGTSPHSPHSYDLVHLTLHKYLGSPHSYDWVHLTLHKYLGSPHSYDWVHLTLHKYLGSPHSYDWYIIPFTNT